MVFISQNANGERIEYRDSKRWLWVLSVLSPSIPLVTVFLLYSTDYGPWASLPAIVYFGIVPLLDWLIGEDFDNPPEEVIEALSSDPYYRLLLFSVGPHLLGWLCRRDVGSAALDIPILAKIALVIGTGAASGSGLTVGHELGHKPNLMDQAAAKLVNAVTGYAHFCIEHNRGHHLMVSTPEDPASARYGESIYRFAFRELPGAARRGWQLERARLAKKGLPFWHWRNDLLQGYAISAAAAFVLVSWLGLVILPFIFLHHFYGWLQLTFANYVEHYGLLRQKLPSGRYEPCQPHHSWNTNHIVSNLMLFHLQRHSDHHANPLRPYQSLRNFAELPRLPSGYPGTYLLALVPPLWFLVMNPKVEAWAGGDMSKINRLP